MSTKVSIKWRHRVEGQPGFHLYDDCLDTVGGNAAAAESQCANTEPPVYLELDGVAAELRTLPTGGVQVTVTIPRDMARELGLLPAGTLQGN